MKSAEYIARNLKGFESDNFIKLDIEKLRDKFKIQTAVETGTFLGGTTKILASMFKDVYSCEINEENYIKSQAYLKGLDNVMVFHDSSPLFLNALLPLIHSESILFFLDAHWKNACPLLEELHAIAYHEIKPVIVIHDFKVPDRPDLGFDSYNGQDFTFEWIKDAIINIYGEKGYYYHFNEESEGAQRGVIYIYPR